MAGELLPIVSGLFLGILLGPIQPVSRKHWAAPIVIALALLATVASGEFRASWGFLLEDITLVTLSACVGFIARCRLLTRAAR